MNINKLADEFLKAIAHSSDHNIDPELYNLLSKINNTPSHYLATADMTEEELLAAQELADMGYVQLIPAGHGVSREVLRRNFWGEPKETGPRVISPMKRHLPERYVMLARGDHALGTFDFVR